MKRAVYHVIQSALWVLVTQFVAIGLCVASMRLMINDGRWEVLAYLAGVLSPALFALAGFAIPRSFMVTTRNQLFAFVAVWIIAAVGFDVLVHLGYIAEAAQYVCLPQQLTAAAVFQIPDPNVGLKMGVHLLTIVYFGAGFWFRRRNLKKRGLIEEKEG